MAAREEGARGRERGAGARLRECIRAYLHFVERLNLEASTPVRTARKRETHDVRRKPGAAVEQSTELHHRSHTRRLLPSRTDDLIRLALYGGTLAVRGDSGEKSPLFPITSIEGELP